MRLFVLNYLLFTGFLAFGQHITRIEPPNWWVGMVNPKVEILLYSKESLANATPQTNYPGVAIKDHQHLENPKYLNLVIEIGADTKPGKIPIDLILPSGQKISISFPILERRKDKSQQQGFDTRDVIYLMTPDRFSNGIPENDWSGMLEEPDRGNKIGRHGGDIRGVLRHLDYLADMGFTGIWLNPILENNMPKYSYHGYAITDFYKVDPRFGSNEDYRDLAQKADDHGLKIMADMVLNHCGLHHWWMSDLPAKDWINYHGQPYTETNHRKTIQLDPYAAQMDIDVLEKGWFVRTMPDLNLTNEVLGIYMLQNTIWWIEYTGIDGIRMDTYLYPNKHYMSKWAKAIVSEYPELTITGEVWYEQPAVLAYWQTNNENQDLYQSNLESLLDFPINHNLIKALNTEDTWGSGWLYLFETLGLDFLYPDPNNLVVFADNHDMSRIYAQLGHDIDKVKMAMAFVLTTRGIPQVYYGTEVLMDSPFDRDDGLVRSDFPGGWADDKINAFTGAGLTEEQKDMQGFIKTLLQWRKNSPVIHNGKLLHYVPEKDMYVYFRHNENKKVMIILNKNKEETALSLDRFHEILHDSQEGTDIITGEKINLQKNLIQVKTGPLILELKK